MKKNFFSVFFFTISFCLTAQQPSEATQPEGHEHYLKLLNSAKDSLYNTILESYDSYIEQHPDNFLIQIERCKLIETAYYDAYEEYNPNYEESEECIEYLMSKFPGVPEVLLYKSEFLYGDSAISFLENVVFDYNDNPDKWSGKPIWKVYNKLAELYSYDEKAYKSIKYAELAIIGNDTLDLSLLLARQYKQLSQNTKAIDILLNNLDSLNNSWDLNEKGKLLLELGLPDKALEAFRYARKDTSAWQDAGALAQAMIENGLYAEAREFLVKDTISSWKRSQTLRKLFQYDLKYSTADLTIESYNSFVKENFWNDPLGIYRLQIFFSEPLLYWTFYDILRIVLLILVFAVVIVLPYLWILPIHYLGNYLKNKGMVLQPSDFRWTHKHFWIISSLLLLLNLATILIYEYDTLFSEGETAETISNNVANMTVFFFSGSFLAAALLVKKYDITIFWGNRWSKQKSILSGIGLMFLLKTGLFFYSLISGYFLLKSFDPLCFSSIRDNIISVNQYYHPAVGFLFTVLLVPLYEEVIFRGILLSACEKSMKFFWANGIQSLVFALMHQEWKLIPFFFAFGFAAGYYRKRSQSLAPGISLHVTNNLLAFLAFLR